MCTTVQRLLGHTQIKTTQRFAHLSHDTLFDATNSVNTALVRQGGGRSYGLGLTRHHTTHSTLLPAIEAWATPTTSITASSEPT